MEGLQLGGAARDSDEQARCRRTAALATGQGEDRANDRLGQEGHDEKPGHPNGAAERADIGRDAGRRHALPEDFPGRGLRRLEPFGREAPREQPVFRLLQGIYLGVRGHRDAASRGRGLEIALQHLVELEPAQNGLQPQFVGFLRPGVGPVDPVGAEHLIEAAHIAEQGRHLVDVTVRGAIDFSRIDGKQGVQQQAGEGVAGGDGPGIDAEPAGLGPHRLRREIGGKVGERHVLVRAVLVDGVQTVLQLDVAGAPCPQDGLHAAGVEHVVRVQEDAQIARGHDIAGVHRGDMPARVLEHRRDAVAVGLDDGPGIVGRPVIHHHDLIRRMALSEGAVNRRVQELAVVVVDHHDGQRGGETGRSLGFRHARTGR